MNTIPVTTSEMNQFKSQVDKFHERIEEHQDYFTEAGTKEYWKLQDIKCKIAELMNMI